MLAVIAGVAFSKTYACAWTKEGRVFVWGKDAGLHGELGPSDVAAVSAKAAAPGAEHAPEDATAAPAGAAAAPSAGYAPVAPELDEELLELLAAAAPSGSGWSPTDWEGPSSAAVCQYPWSSSDWMRSPATGGLNESSNPRMAARSEGERAPGTPTRPSRPSTDAGELE